MNRCRFIEAQHAHYPIRFLCHVLGIPASGYAWQANQQRAVVGTETPAWETALANAFGTINAAAAPVGFRWRCVARAEDRTKSGT